MNTFREPLRILSTDEMEAIHGSALDILEKIGMRIASPEALKYLKKYGCSVDESSNTVRFPKEVVSCSVERMKSTYEDSTRAANRMAVRYSHIRFKKESHRVHPDFTTSAGGFCAFIFDLNGKRRSANHEDVLRSINLVNHLEHIDYTGLPVSAQEVPQALRPVKMAGELVKYTTKLGGVETFDKDDVKYLIDIAEVVAADQMKSNPVLVGYAESRSPLCLDRNMVEIFMEYVRRGFPQTMDTMPSGGYSAPITAAGILAIGAAETLGPMVLAHAIDENATVGVDFTPSYGDMRSGIYQYASAQRLPLLVARVQMISEYYGCPSGIHGGKTDSCFPDIQTGVEKASTMLLPLLAGAVGIGTVGHLENAVTFSPQQLVIDSEISGIVHRALRGIEVNKKTLALDVIRDVGIGGSFLGHPHTAENFRKEMHLSDLFERSPWETAHSQPWKGIDEKASEFASRFWCLPQPILSEHQIGEIDRIVARAGKELL